MCFEMHGLEYEVRAAVNMILELDIVKVLSSLPYLNGVCADGTSRN